MSNRFEFHYAYERSWHLRANYCIYVSILKIYFLQEGRTNIKIESFTLAFRHQKNFCDRLSFFKY